MRNVGIVAGIVLVVLLLLLCGGGALALGGFGMRGMMLNGYGVRGASPLGLFFRPFAGLVLCAVWLVVIGVVVFVVAWLMGKNIPAALPAPKSETPLDILQARYARGEITKEQYDAMRKDLE
jgi:putative membrane protein